ncbi:MAG: fumarylacetoacetate hydrolase family protein [Pseudomonadota bacterium]
MMGVSVIRYTSDSAKATWGVLRGEAVHKLEIDSAHHRDVLALWFDDRIAFDRAIAESAESLDTVTILAPLADDIQLFCQGLNYASHREESGAAIDPEDDENLLFMKAASSICGANDNIIRPDGCRLLDYEIELGLVLRESVNQAVQVDEAHLKDYIGALILCNDVSARDFMFGAPMLQWFKGKSQRTFCPAGPILYLLDEGDIDQLYSLELKLWMNGELKQQAVTDQLIHKPAKTLTELSAMTDMAAGDCILTGTPGGVLAGHNLKSALAIFLNFGNDRKRREKFTAAQLQHAEFLQPGDVLELQIKSLDGGIDLGRQRSVIVEA